MATIDSTGNTITVAGALDEPGLRRLLAAIHDRCIKKGYPDVTLDFSKCTSANSGPMLVVCADATKKRQEGITFTLTLPQLEHQTKVFKDLNWAHLIDPKHWRPSSFKGHRQVPATVFGSIKEQGALVNRMVGTLIGATSGLDRKDLVALEWAINEVTDNVLTHSEAEFGIAQLSTFPKAGTVELSVVDPGVGIPKTLGPAFPAVKGDPEILRLAVDKGVTRDSSFGQGNGLYGSMRIAAVANGFLHIHSGNGVLQFEDDEFRTRFEAVPVRGTLLILKVDVSESKRLGEALRFDDYQLEATGYLAQYEGSEDGEIVFDIQAESQSVGSRMAGIPVRARLLGLLQLYPKARLRIDFGGVNVISSSFADEVIGKLFKTLGPVQFMTRISLSGLSPLVKSLIDKAILQRQGADEQPTPEPSWVSDLRRVGKGKP